MIETTRPLDDHPQGEPSALWASLTWDGILPLAVALFPLFVDTFFPPQQGQVHPLAFVACTLVPLAAAMARAHHAEGQIRKACEGKLPILRQFALAAAILVMGVFEVAVAVLTFMQQRPAQAWLIPLVAYALYLTIVSLALRPTRVADRRLDWESGF